MKKKKNYYQKLKVHQKNKKHHHNFNAFIINCKNDKIFKKIEIIIYEYVFMYFVSLLIYIIWLKFDWNEMHI